MITSNNELQTRLAQPGEERVQYCAENRQFSSHVDGLQFEKTTCYCQLRNVQHEYDGALARKQKRSVVLKKLRTSVEEARRHAKLFHNKVTIYNDRFNTDLREGFATFMI